MAKQGFKVADSDMHVIEPADLWLNHIDPRFKERAPVGRTEVPRDVAIVWEGKRIADNTPLSRRMLLVTQTAQADRYEHAERRGYDAVSQLEVMERKGIDVAALFPRRGLFAPWLLYPDGRARRMAWRRRGARPPAPAQPVLRRQCWVSIECDETPGGHAAEALPDRIVFSTDYPHGDSKYPRATEQFLELPMPEATAGRILWDHCAQLFGF